MRVTVLGTGNIGTTIGLRWRQRGHTVTYGVREPGAERYLALSEGASVEAIPEAVRDADAVLIAIPGAAVANLLETYGPDLAGKLLLDASNDLSRGPLHHIPLYEARAPDGRVYRAFNTLGWENFAEPAIGGLPADLFYSGPQTEDRQFVEQLIADVGLRPVYVGDGVAAADLLDGVTRLWFTLAMGQGHGRRVAFATLGLPPAEEL
jgi:8-hydroxy-5-deazaflavin:NADPH oxidoreductase